jgi:hypothetical protein
MSASVPELVLGRERRLDALGQLHLGQRRRAEGRAALERGLRGLHDLAARVAEHQRPPRQAEVREAAAVGREQVGPRARLDEHRVPAHGLERAHRRVHAADQRLPGAGEQLRPRDPARC